MSNNKKSLSYQIGEILGWLFIKIVKGIAMLLWNGIIVASLNNIVVAIINIGLIIASIIVYIAYGNVLVMIFVIFLCAVVFSIWNYFKDYPIKKKQKYFTELFNNLKFHAPDESLPLYLGEKDISNYISSISFQTLMPVSFWQSKKELLEMHMNVKIVNIRQSRKDNRIVSVHILKEDLPTRVDWTDSFINKNDNVLNIGVGLYGIVGMNLEKYPHAFVAGETGSGKSNILKCLIHQSITKGYEVILIDFKRGVSFSAFSDILDIHYEYSAVIKVIKELVIETKKRLDIFREYRVDNINDYNRVSFNNLKRKIIFIDELAELLKTRDKETAKILNDSIETLTRLSRAVGIHLIMGIQRPDSTIISGQIKNNVPYRVCGRFTDKEPSRIMLASDRASTLPNIKGRFIVKDNYMQEIQAFYFYRVVKQNNNQRVVTQNITEQAFNNHVSNQRTLPQPVMIAQQSEQPKEKSKPLTKNDFDLDFSGIEL